MAAVETKRSSEIRMFPQRLKAFPWRYEAL